MNGYLSSLSSEFRVIQAAPARECIKILEAEGVAVSNEQKADICCRVSHESEFSQLRERLATALVEGRKLTLNDLPELAPIIEAGRELETMVKPSSPDVISPE